MKRNKHAMKYTGHSHLQGALLIVIVGTLQRMIYKA